MLFKEMLRQAITGLFCCGAKRRDVCLFLRHIRKLNSNSLHQEVINYYIFKEYVILHILVLKCISLTK